MKCIECQSQVEQIDNDHLLECCGLTLQEYALRHHLSLDLLVNESMVNQSDQASLYSLPADEVTQRSYTIIRALLDSGSFLHDDAFVYMQSDIRRLDELLWYLRELTIFGFQFRQEYFYTSNSHRVVCENKIKTPIAFQDKYASHSDEIDFLLYLSIIIAQLGYLRKSYVFLSLPMNQQSDALLTRITNEYQIRWTFLESDETLLVRTESLEDAQRLLLIVQSNLQHIPCASERFYTHTEEATVSKELVFDSAHFITDHPGKCENLHGGRYTLNVKIKDRIDPLTGFVIDYGDLKKIVKHRVIDKLDHQNLNYVCSDLGWRSSTELLNIFIWEQLIDYLPSLIELKTYETTQSYCSYTGPSIDQLQKSVTNPTLKHFSRDDLGSSLLRKQLSLKKNDCKMVGSLKIVKK